MTEKLNTLNIKCSFELESPIRITLVEKKKSRVRIPALLIMVDLRCRFDLKHYINLTFSMVHVNEVKVSRTLPKRK